MKAPNARRPPSSGTTIHGLLQPKLWLLDQSEDNTRETAGAKSTLRESPPCGVPGATSGTADRASSNVTITSGTLIAKIQRHEV